MTIANSGTVEIEKDGKTISATYTVWKGVVTVEYAESSKSTQVGGSPVDTVASLLLREMVNSSSQ